MSADAVAVETVLEAMRFRHACKVFDAGRKIPDSQFAAILECARLSPSSYGFEPWKFLVVQNMALREKLRTVTWGAQRSLPTASHFVVILARTAKGMRYDASYIWHIMRDVHRLPETHLQRRAALVKTFQESDFHLLDSERLLFEWAARQTYVALGNMMTAAALMGIDSCPIEGFPVDAVNRILREDCAVDTQEMQVSCMVAFGYRSEPQPAKSRQTLEAIVQRFD